MTEKLYPCNPLKNKKCNKRGCFLNGGPCQETRHIEYADVVASPKKGEGMTAKDAIFILECVEAHGIADDAKKLAIEALKAEPTKHGRWINRDDKEFECSNCGNLEMLMSNYCRRCGAKMQSTMGQVNADGAVNNARETTESKEYLGAEKR